MPDRMASRPEGMIRIVAGPECKGSDISQAVSDFKAVWDFAS